MGATKVNARNVDDKLVRNNNSENVVFASGRFVVSTTFAFPVLSVETNGVGSRPYITFKSNNSDLGFLGYGATGSDIMYLFNYSSAAALILGANSQSVLTITAEKTVGIGTVTPATCAAFEVASTTKGVLIPRMTTTQRDAIASPVDGLVIYNTTTNKFQGRAGGAWVDLH